MFLPPNKPPYYWIESDWSSIVSDTETESWGKAKGGKGMMVTPGLKRGDTSFS
ncbi:hypothetical protein YSY43_32740 [Paenibacillus sp. YSY-4.3]